MSGAQFCYYADDGAVHQFLAARLEVFCRPHGIAPVALRRGDMQAHLRRYNDKVLAFFLPGNRSGQNYFDGFGADGCDSIRNYVALGGCYIGICAGGYLGAAQISFKSASLVKKRTSPLGMLRGIAVGELPLLLPESISSVGWQTANVVPVDFNSCGMDRTSSVIYWGGPAYRPAPGERIETLARYRGQGENSRAVVAGSFGMGRAVLSGVHAEMSVDVMRLYPKPFAEYADDRRYQGLMRMLAADSKALDSLFARIAGQAFHTMRGQKFLHDRWQKTLTLGS